MNAIGTRNRNHCPYCLWSLHVDEEISGDRRSRCNGLMEPIGLTFKNEGFDKYVKKRQGEIMLVHQCIKCNKFSINRLAGDDDPQEVLKIFNNHFLLDRRPHLKLEGIGMLTEKDREEVERQLFGEKNF